MAAKAIHPLQPGKEEQEKKADPPAKAAGEEKPFSVEDQKPRADPRPPVREQTPGAASPPSPWTGIDVAQIRKRLSAFMEGAKPPHKLVEWICTTFEGLCQARDVCAALEAAWNRSAAPGKKNAPRNWNWFYTTLRNALIPEEAARLPEQPASPRPQHQVQPGALHRGMKALDSIVESVLCPRCGDSIIQYADGAFKNCKCGRRASKPSRKQPAASICRKPSRYCSAE